MLLYVLKQSRVDILGIKLITLSLEEEKAMKTTETLLKMAVLLTQPNTISLFLRC